MIKREDYYDNKTWEDFLNFSRHLPSPHVVINLDCIISNYQKTITSFPYASIYYAVKACPTIEVLETLKDCGACFDIASIYELDKVLSLGVTPDKLSFGNTIKKASDIKYAFSKGVKLFATDSQEDLDNIAKFAPEAKIYVRIAVETGESADWPLSKKFGCDIDQAVVLLKNAQRTNIEPYGISFHVGSQQHDVKCWNTAISKTKKVFDAVAKEGITLKMINLGGGFPAQYIEKISGLSNYSTCIRHYLAQAFGEKNMPKVMLEPGRSLVANAGILVSEIVMITRKRSSDMHRWVYIDAGKFNGLIETMDETTKYPIVTERPQIETEHVESVILAGPTCDSYDTLYEKNKYKLPLSLLPGERLYWLSAGAYSLSYASVEFNGFPPIKAYFFKGSQ